MDVVIPVRFPVFAQDVFNHLAARFASNHQIQCVLTLGTSVDEVRLAQAVRMTLDAEPILGCRFVEDKGGPYWERIENLDEVDICSVVVTQDVGSEVQSFLAASMDTCQQPQVQVRVIRQEVDVICIKVNHASCDGGAVKEYVALLADVYSSLCNDPQFVPMPNSQGRRDAYQVFEQLGIKNPADVWNPSMMSPPPTWSLPSMANENQQRTFAVRRFDREEFAALTDAAARLGVTVNDLVLTAYYRAFFDLINPEEGQPMHITLTVDLRRYLPEGKAGALTNLSGADNVSVARAADETFVGTLQRVSAVTRELKSGRPGLSIAIAMEMLNTLGFEGFMGWYQQAREATFASKMSTPFLSNIGVMAPLSFGDKRVVDAYLVTPAMYAPVFMLGASTYDRVLTLTVGYHQSDFQAEIVERFLDLMRHELTSLDG